MRRDVQAVLLVLVGGALVRLFISGAYLNYVKDSLGPFVLVSGALLVGLGLWSAFRDGLFREDSAGEAADPESPGAAPAGAGAVQSGHGSAGDEHAGHEHAGHEHAGHEHAGHEHGGHGPRIAWLLVLPVLTIFLVAPPPLGSYAASTDAVSVTQPAASLPPLPPGDPVDVAVVDYVIRAVWDDAETLKGRTVRMTGFVTPKAGTDAWYLTRMQLSCCAADAQPYLIETVGAPPFAADTWVQVTGSWVPGGGTQRDDAIPRLKVDDVVPVPQPENPYE